MATSKKKVAAAATAVALSAALLLSGTFAWQSISQTALNEASDVINPGGRLHDDFNGTNKDVYVENFTDPEKDGEDIYARIRLEEYFEIVMNYGTPIQSVETVVGTQKTEDIDPSVTGANIVYDDDNNPIYERVYETKIIESVDENGVVHSAVVDGIYVEGADEGSTGYSWWNWQTGGETVYMPTFNLNKDSLAADLNGKFDGAVGVITDRDDDQYTDYVDYSLAENSSKTGTEIYDGDSNSLDEVGTDLSEDNLAIYEGTNVELVENQEHTAATTTHSGELISMAEWQERRELGGDTSNCWVYDTDGWVYWSAPIPAGETTGLLLDGIGLNQVMDDTWYYAINVVAQFVTADDVGKADNTGFYADADQAPTAEAEELLAAIGVKFGDETEEPVTGVVVSIAATYDDGTPVDYKIPEGRSVNLTATVTKNGEEVTNPDIVWTFKCDSWDEETVLPNPNARFSVSSGIKWPVNSTSTSSVILDMGYNYEDPEMTVTATWTDENDMPYTASRDFFDMGSDTTAPTVGVENGETGEQTITISNVSDGDYPLTVKLYEGSASDSLITEDNLLNTVTITNTDGELEYTQNDNSLAEIQNLTTTGSGDVVLTSSFDPVQSCYFGVTVMDAQENQNESDALYVEKSDALTWSVKARNSALNDGDAIPVPNGELTVSAVDAENNPIEDAMFELVPLTDNDGLTGITLTDENKSDGMATVTVNRDSGTTGWTLNVMANGETKSVTLNYFYIVPQGTGYSVGMTPNISPRQTIQYVEDTFNVNVFGVSANDVDLSLIRADTDADTIDANYEHEQYSTWTAHIKHLCTNDCNCGEGLYRVKAALKTDPDVYAVSSAQYNSNVYSFNAKGVYVLVNDYEMQNGASLNGINNEEDTDVNLYLKSFPGETLEIDMDNITIQATNETYKVTAKQNDDGGIVLTFPRGNSGQEVTVTVQEQNNSANKVQVTLSTTHS